MSQEPLVIAAFFDASHEPDVIEAFLPAEHDEAHEDPEVIVALVAAAPCSMKRRWSSRHSTLTLRTW